MVKDYLVNLGLDVVKEKFKNKVYEDQARERLENFIEQQRHYNFKCTMAEEIDFGAVVEYMQSDLIADVRKRLLGTAKERTEAHATIVSKVKAYARANTKLGERRAVQLIEKAIKILRAFYRRKVNAELLFVITEITDTIIDESVEQHTRQTAIVTEEIKRQGENICNKIDSVIKDSSNQAILTNLQLLDDGNFSAVEANLTKFVNVMSGAHRLAPYYGYEIKLADGKQQLRSIPLSADAAKIYPPKFQCRGTIRLGDKYLNGLTPDVIEYANRHQIPIQISVSEAKKLLGSELDPIQHEAEKLIGKEITIPPKPFPKAFACSISFDDVVEFDYILLRTQEVLDDGTIVLTNGEQQGCPFKWTMRANLDTQFMEFDMGISSPSNAELLKYVRIMKKADCGAIISIKALEINQEFARGTLGTLNYETGFESIDEEISFLEMVVTIENYFGKAIDLPEEIWEKDYNFACYLYELIRGDTNQVQWSELEIPMDLTEELKADIATWDSAPYSLSYVGSVSVPLWGETYTIPIIRRFLSVRLKDVDKVKEKAKVLDIGDEIKIEYIPGEGREGVWEDTLHKATDISCSVS